MKKCQCGRVNEEAAMQCISCGLLLETYDTRRLDFLCQHPEQIQNVIDNLPKEKDESGVRIAIDKVILATRWKYPWEATAISAFCFLISALLLNGCSTIGHPVQHTGQNITRKGECVAIGLCAIPPTWPLAVIVAVPSFAFGVPTYYLGCGVAWEAPEKGAFDP